MKNAIFCLVPLEDHPPVDRLLIYFCTCMCSTYGHCFHSLASTEYELSVVRARDERKREELEVAHSELQKQRYNVVVCVVGYCSQTLLTSIQELQMYS